MRVTLRGEQAALWERVEELWRLSVSGSTGAVREALHPDYVGWVTSRGRPFDRAAAMASVEADFRRIRTYTLSPLSVRLFDGLVGVVHYAYTAEVACGAATVTVSGRWTEVYLRRAGRWSQIAVSGGPDGER
jgi:hypothetical protein